MECNFSNQNIRTALEYLPGGELHSLDPPKSPQHENWLPLRSIVAFFVFLKAVVVLLRLCIFSERKLSVHRWCTEAFNHVVGPELRKIPFVRRSILIRFIVSRALLLIITPEAYYLLWLVKTKLYQVLLNNGLDPHTERIWLEQGRVFSVESWGNKILKSMARPEVTLSCRTTQEWHKNKERNVCYFLNRKSSNCFPRWKTWNLEETFENIMRPTNWSIDFWNELAVKIPHSRIFPFKNKRGFQKINTKLLR